MMPEFGLDFETGASALYKTRVSERMSCEESAIFFANRFSAVIFDFFFVYQNLFWSTKFFLVDQKNVKLIEQLVYQRD